MRGYFLRRLLLVPVTLIGVTMIVFAITRLVPGGPIEQAIMQAEMGGAHGRFGPQNTTPLSDQQLDELKRYYGFDLPWYEAYVKWLGKVARGDLGMSYRYGEPVAQLIAQRLPISLYFGGITLVLTYVVCVPLGILKAIRHRTWVDTFTSILIFVGYAVPGYVLGVLLLVFFSAHLQWFPMGGFVSENFSDLTPWGQILDLLRHTALPLACYLVGSFAFVTLLIKNHLLDNLAADYMRTAVGKGVPAPKAVVRHALRNSLIPLATLFGDSVSIFVFGSFLIETIFDIDGFGLLGYDSVLDRDYPVVMGVLLLSSLLLVLGNILSDVLVALVDPRVKFR
jgi:microcin C transport system permease protein